jgi:hypothetical protein
MAQNSPLWTSPLYATDEHVAIRATADFPVLCPAWQTLASGSDGVISHTTPWVLSSASNTFDTQGVAAQHVIHLTGPRTAFPGGGILLAVDSALDGSVTLRRIAYPLNAGMPPTRVDLSGVSFTINTLTPQIESATMDLKKRFMIDEYANTYRMSAWIYQGAEDAYRELRDACVLSVLVDRYTAEVRTERGDFALKLTRVRQQLDDVLARVQVRWGPFGNSAQPATLFGTKLSR